MVCFLFLPDYSKFELRVGLGHMGLHGVGFYFGIYLAVKIVEVVRFENSLFTFGRVRVLDACCRKRTPSDIS